MDRRSRRDSETSSSSSAASGIVSPQQSPRTNKGDVVATGAFPSFTTVTSHNSSSASSSASSERTLLASNRSKNIEPPGVGGRVSSLGMAAAAAQLQQQQQQHHHRSRSAEPVQRKLQQPPHVTTRVFQPSVVRGPHLPATVLEEGVDSSSEDEYDRSRTSSWTAFGNDDSRLPTISPPNLPIIMDHHPTEGSPASSFIGGFNNHGSSGPLSPTNTDTTAAESDSSGHLLTMASYSTASDEHRRLHTSSKRALTDTALDGLLANEDQLLELVAKINTVYETTLRKDAPFMTFVLCGVQSAGKSYLVERFMNAVLNIVDDGTATRCPLDITCIHNADLDEPLCDLEGLELTTPGVNLSAQDVFERVTQHNRRLEADQRVSNKALHLIYRANNVQNMRFVDTPGTKMNQDGTRDDRRAIQDILVQEMRKPNAKLCILLQSTEEFATQPIVRFCDDTFGSRGQWMGRAIFLMTKADLLIVNKRSAADANKFLAKFHDNHCFPHLIITPTLTHAQGLTTPEALFHARRAVLETADDVEARSFDKWLADHDRYNAETGGGSGSSNSGASTTSSSNVLHEEVKLRIGFASAKKVMRNIMLEDTRKRLPEVLLELRGQLETLQRQWDSLDHRRKLQDPDQLKPLAMQALRQIEDRVSKYINGNLNACRTFPERMQSLGEEIQDESFSEWSSKKLNHHKETPWRQRIEQLDNQFPAYVQPHKAFLGGKQIQRAIEFFRAVMVDSLPDPQGEFRDLVANSVGYLANGTLRENWEQALVQIVEACVKEMTHPGINYVVKHVGYICRRLFRLAMDDIKQDDRFYDAFKVLPVAVEKHFMAKFDTMLWGLMEKSADRISMALEPMYSTIDPSISNFPSLSATMPNPDPRQGGGDREESDSSITSGSRSVKDRVQSVKTLSADGVKNVVKRVAEARAVSKTSFLPEAKSSMITDSEADQILMKSFQYIVTLLEFNLVNLRFQMNHHLVLGFKESLRGPFVDDIVLNTNWNELIERDYDLDDQMKDLEDQIAGVKASLNEVKGLMD